MKKVVYTLLVSILCINLLSAQKSDPKLVDKNNASENNQWILGFGVNAVDNSDAKFEDLTNSDRWAFAKAPFYLNIEANIDGQFSVATSLSFNYFTEGKIFEGATILGEDEGGNDTGYLAVDLAIKYSLGKLLNSKSLDPYVFVGPGISHFGDYKTQENPTELVEAINIFTFNTGFGLNYWFSSTWGVNLNASAKWGVATEYTNHFQSSLGILYRIN